MVHLSKLADTLDHQYAAGGLAATSSRGEYNIADLDTKVDISRLRASSGSRAPPRSSRSLT
jgi:hypothetical protein